MRNRQRERGVDPVLPSQAVRPGPDTPERRLLAAVLEDAVRTYQQLAGVRDVRGRRLFREVAEWFDAEGGDTPFAFVRICEVLALDSAWVRTGLQRWRAAHATLELPDCGWPIPSLCRTGRPG